MSGLFTGLTLTWYLTNIANAREYKILNYKSNLEGLAAPEAP